jgi:hypothetical protein
VFTEVWVDEQKRVVCSGCGAVLAEFKARMAKTMAKMAKSEGLAKKMAGDVKGVAKKMTNVICFGRGHDIDHVLPHEPVPGGYISTSHQCKYMTHICRYCGVLYAVAIDRGTVPEVPGRGGDDGS